MPCTCFKFGIFKTVQYKCWYICCNHRKKIDSDKLYIIPIGILTELKMSKHSNSGFNVFPKVDLLLLLFVI